ncbi:unnamed protein product, partial [Linum tenue]
PHSPVQSNSPSSPLVSEIQEEGQGGRNTNPHVPVTETPRTEQRSPVTGLEGETEQVDSSAQHSAADLSLEGGSSNGITKKRKGRGPGKGVKPGHNLSLEFHDNRIITTQAAREISAIFKRSINGPWITFSKYPASELETLIARCKDSGFTYTGSEETFNDMEMSDKNKGNREKSELAATGGSAPLAKYRHEEDGKIEAEAEKVSQGEEPNRFVIYQEVIGPQRPKRVIGMGHGVSSVDVFGPASSQEDRTKERGKMMRK